MEPIAAQAATPALLEKYNIAGPRYTSYPTAPVWQDSYTYKTHTQVIQETNALLEPNPYPLSIYVHLPFCESRCLFCGCNVVITKQKDQAEKYLDYLFREIDMAAQWIDRRRPLVQLHWGGGTPTYLSEDQMERLFHFLSEKFNLTPTAEVAIEIDPRVTTPSQITLLRKLGFNRISLGVQDFDPIVQETIHRVQPLGMTAETVAQCRALGFEGLNFDLIYGLPHQTVRSFSQTLNEVVALNPDRIALYNYAYVPWLSPHQAQMPEGALPATNVKFQILQTALQKLTEAGYLYIGMDHFAKPDDELSLALAQGNLHRNFMGYTVQKTAQKGNPLTPQSSKPSDLYGFGVSAISGLQNHFAQNWRKLSQYYEAIDQGHLPTMRGYILSRDDKIRQQVILAILCQGRVNYADFDQRFGIRFTTYFLDALLQLKEISRDGLVEFANGGFTVTPLGRLFSRNIAMPFDAYLTGMNDNKPTFSKTL
jgi:oxygen-independent coproporphyrinogen-3 oxidase